MVYWMVCASIAFLVTFFTYLIVQEIKEWFFMKQDSYVISTSVGDLVAIYEYDDDTVIITFNGEQIGTITNACDKGAPVYDRASMEKWIWDRYYDVACHIVESRRMGA